MESNEELNRFHIEAVWNKDLDKFTRFKICDVRGMPDHLSKLLSMVSSDEPVVKRIILNAFRDIMEEDILGKRKERNAKVDNEVVTKTDEKPKPEEETPKQDAPDILKMTPEQIKAWIRSGGKR